MRRSIVPFCTFNNQLSASRSLTRTGIPSSAAANASIPTAQLLRQHISCRPNAVVGIDVGIEKDGYLTALPFERSKSGMVPLTSDHPPCGASVRPTFPLSSKHRAMPRQPRWTITSFANFQPRECRCCDGLFLAFNDEDGQSTVFQPRLVRPRPNIKHVAAPRGREILVARLQDSVGQLHLRVIKAEPILADMVRSRPDVRNCNTRIVATAASANDLPTRLRVNTSQLRSLHQFSIDPKARKRFKVEIA